PIQYRTLVIRGKLLSEAIRSEIRFMRIKCLDLQKPVVRVAVAIEKTQPGVKALHGWELMFLLYELAVDHVMVSALLRPQIVLTGVVFVPNAIDRRGQKRFPGV